MGHRIAKHTYDKQGTANNGLGNLVKSTFYIVDHSGNVIAVYERTVNASNQSVTFEHTEKYIYGSSNLGNLNIKVPMLGSQNATYSMINKKHKIGEHIYTLSEHRNNILSTVSDKPVPHTTNGTTHDYYMADIIQSSDYSPFGVELSGRNFVKTGATESKRGFQGQEEDDEIKGEGNSINYTFRMHDPRLGRFFAVDPLAKQYCYNSPYAFSENKVIQYVELEGLEVGELGNNSYHGAAISVARNPTEAQQRYQSENKATGDKIGYAPVYGILGAAGAAYFKTWEVFLRYLGEEAIEEILGFPYRPDIGDAAQYGIKKELNETPNPYKIHPNDPPSVKIDTRKNLAKDFYEMHGEKNIDSKLDGIDFNSEVRTMILKKRYQNSTMGKS